MRKGVGCCWGGDEEGDRLVGGFCGGYGLKWMMNVGTPDRDVSCHVSCRTGKGYNGMFSCYPYAYIFDFIVFMPDTTYAHLRCQVRLRQG